MGLLTVSVWAAESYVLVRVTGEADMTVSGQLNEPLMAAMLAQARHLIVDMSGLSFIDVACVRVLAGVCETGEDARGTLVLAAPQPIVVRMLELCGAHAVSRSIRPRLGSSDDVAMAEGQNDSSRPPSAAQCVLRGQRCPGTVQPRIVERGR